MSVKRRKIMAVLLTVCLLAGIMPARSTAAESASASFAADGGNVTYEIMDGKTVKITGCDNDVTAVVIPDTIENLPVTEIGDGAFYEKGKLVSVKLPVGVQTISDRAFYACKKLAEINLADCSALQTIGYNAFNDTGLTAVKLPGNVSSIGECAFTGGLENSLKQADLSACLNLTKIPYALFYYNSQLTEVKLPASITVIEREAFAFCTALEKVDLSYCLSLTEIQEKAFYGDSALTQIALSPALVTIGKEAFNSCTALTGLDFTACTSLKTIEEFAFNRTAVTSLSFPASLETLERGAFGECEKLTAVTWPQNSSLTVLGGFNECTALPVSVFNEGVSLPNVTEIGELAFENCTFEEVTIPSNIREIGVYAFGENGEEYESKLKKLTLMPGVELIGESAFCGCPIEGTLNIPGTVKEVGCYAFGATTITGLNIALGVEKIDGDAFSSCSGLEGKTVVLPETVSYVGRDAFDGIDEEKPLTLEFRNRDVMFEEAPYYSGQVTVGEQEYYSPFTMSYETSNVIIRAYEKNSAGESSMPKLLYDALMGDPDKEESHVYRFEAISEETCTVTGKLPAGASVKVYNNGRELPLTVTDTSFAAVADKGADVSATVTMDGYYEKHFIKKTIETDWNLGEITFSDNEKIPANLMMRVDFKNVTVTGFDQLHFTLKAGDTVLAEGENYTLQYPYLVLKENVSADTLTLTVEADALGCTGTTTTAKRASGVFEVALTPWGKLKLTAGGGFAGDNHILVFDSNGVLAGRSTIGKKGVFTTDSLRAGSYTVVAFNANDSFSSVSSVDALQTLGLTKDTDYKLQMVTVADNETTELALMVPILRTNVRSVVNKEKCSVVAEQNKLIPGSSLRTRIYYSFADKKTGTITVVLPKGASVDTLYTKTEVLTQGTDYTVEADKVTIPVRESDGLLYLTLTFSEAVEQSIAVSATVDGTTVPIGSTLIKVKNLFVEPDSLTPSVRGNEVQILTEPEKEVILKLNEYEVARGVTNKKGTCKLTYDLPDETCYRGENLKLTAECGEYSSDFVMTVLRGQDVVLEEWSGCNNGSWLWMYDMYNSLAHQNHNWYFYKPGDKSQKHWTIRASFVGTTEPSGVITYAGMLDDSVKELPMSLVKTEAVNDTEYRYTFAAEMYLSAEGDVPDEAVLPVNFAIDWAVDGEEYTYDAATVEQNRKQAEEQTVKRQGLIEQIKKEIGEPFAFPDSDVTVDSSQYIFGAKYRVSGKDWFKDLPEEGQQVLYNLEKETDKAAQAFSDMLGLKKNLTEYSSWDEVIAELGLTITKNTLTADELREEGYYVCEQDGSFTAFRSTGAEAQTAGVSVKEDSAGTGDVGGFTFIDQNGNQVDFTGDATGNNWQALGTNALGGIGMAYDNAASWLLGEVHNFMPLQQADIVGFTGVSYGFKGLGVLAGFYSAWQDSSSVVDWTVREGQIQDYIDELKLYENRYAADSECSYAIMRERHTAEMVRFYVRRERTRTKMNIKIGALATFLGVFTGKAGDASAAIGGVNDLLSGSEGSYNAVMLENLLIELDQRTLIRKRSCEHTDMEEIMKKTRKTAKVNALIDPSGIVYEAVESNTLSDVKATIWYADDENGTNARIWNAQDYDQINPQITDKTGAYAWDVLSGWWQVRFEKDGYESTQTEWMQVPPPRVGLKTAMVSKALPRVEAARAYPDYIELMFSQYMDTSKKLTLPAGMSAEWQNVEDGYSKVLHITRTGGFTLGETVSVTVDGAYNYAGKALSAYNSGNLTVSARPAEILLNYENTISVQAGTTRNLTVRVKDSEGNVMSGAAVDAVIGNTDFAGLTAQSVLTDKDGKAVFVMNAQLPGYTDITFKVNGTSLTKSAELHVTVDENRPKRPTAQIGTTQFAEDAPKENYITVQSGGQLVLTAEEGVTIYYTTDDTCPCQNSDSRMVYTGPVTIKKNTKFRIAAYKEGMDYSERLNITVTVENGIMPGDVNGDGTVNLLDAQMTLKAALKIIALTDDQKEAADVDGKGGVTLADAQLILKYALKIINTFN